MKEDLKKLFEASFPFWSHLKEEDRNLLVDGAKLTHHRKDDHIHDGNECTGVIFVKTGCLRLYMLSDEGKDITLYRLFPGDMCMLSASCVIKSIHFPVFVDAEEESDCVIISGSAFASVAQRVPEMKIFALETAVSRFSDVMWVLQQILFMSFDRRLATFLLEEAEKTGKNTIKLTHEQIAKYMGSAREVVSRMLKYFSNEGIIKASRGSGITLLDRERLEALSIEH